MFKSRRNIRLVFWLFIATLIVLHVVMAKPVWHLIARVSAVGGSTGWHRYHLIDQAINRVGEWFLVGVRTTGHWGFGLQDVTNQYILEGVRGGGITLFIFVWLLVELFRNVGDQVKRSGSNVESLFLAWAIGVMIFIHAVSFLGVAYFGQASVVLYITLALVPSVQNSSMDDNELFDNSN